MLKHAVLITNLKLLESVEPESSHAKGIERRRSVWEAHFGIEARADKEREIQLYLECRRDCEKSEGVQAIGQDVAISLPVVKIKVRRPTKLVGDDRRTGNNCKKPYRMVAMDGDGEANHRRLEERSSVETEPMVHPEQVDLLEELLEKMTFSRPYEGARYELAECTVKSKWFLRELRILLRGLRVAK